MDVVIIVGFVGPLLGSTGRHLPADSVLVVDEPEAAVERGTAERLVGLPAVRGLMTWEYQLPGAADRFYLRHQDMPVAAVIPAVEYAVPFAARLAERYGVPGAGLGAAEILREKSLLRAVTAAAGIANPISAAVSSAEDVRAFQRRHPGRIIVKPSNRQASLGTWIIDDPGDVDAAWAAAVEQQEPYMPSRGLPLRMLAERFVAGPEYSVEMLVDRGVRRFANVTEKLLFPGPRPIEMGHVVPADLPPATSDDLIAATEEVAAAVGFGSGFLHCEWIISMEGVPYLVECAGRLPGDWIMTLIENAWPIDITHRYFQVMRGQEPAPAPTEAAAACAVRFLAPTAGVVEAVDGLEEARAVPDVFAVESLVSTGTPISELRSSSDRVAAALAWATTAEDARDAAATAISKVRVKIRPAI